MLCCNDIVTIVQRKYDTEADTESYLSTVINGVSWFSKLATAVTEKGVKTADITYIRIPAENMPDGLAISNNDWAVKGVLEKQVEKQADVKESGLEYVSIVSVADNRRGNLKHVALVGRK